MAKSVRLDSSLKRLSAALDRLEAAADRRQIADRVGRDHDEALAVMQDDRSRLAVELDSALSRARQLGDANAEAMRRLQNAGAALRNLLEEDESTDQD